MSDFTINLDDVTAAAGRISSGVLTTPFLESRTLSDIVGATVWLKFENQQFTASFKERGALNRLLLLSDDARRSGVIAASAGNHAQGVAYHAQRLGITAVIVMPRFTPAVKVERTRAFGAEIVIAGDDFDEAAAAALELAEERHLTLVHPYNDPAVMAGQGTIALEMLSAVPDLDAIVVSVGGGGLISGIAVAAKALRPEIEIYGVQSDRYPGMIDALADRPTIPGAGTIAEGIAVSQPGKLTLPIVRDLVDEVVGVADEDIEAAILLLLEVEKTVVEGAGAAGLAAVLRYREMFAGKRLGVVLCGGNIDPAVLAGIIRRGLVQSGRLARLRIEVRDVPGALADITRLLGDGGANIEEIHHQRAFSHRPVREAVVEVEVQTRDHDHVERLVDELKRGGYTASVMTD